MASRKEQKERARARREAEEKARAERARRDRRLRMGGGALVVVVAVIAVVIGAGASGGGSATPIRPAPNGAKLPARKLTNLGAAVRAAGCTTINTPLSIADSAQNRQHVSVSNQMRYATNPPSYGAHAPTPASDGLYGPGHTPAIGNLVHALEHGRIEYQYRPGLAGAEVRQLEALFQEGEGTLAGGQLLLMFQNPSRMNYDVAATAWGHVLGCPTFNSRVFDALRAFRLAYTNKAPENLGTGPE